MHCNSWVVVMAMIAVVNRALNTEITDCHCLLAMLATQFFTHSTGFSVNHQLITRKHLQRRGHLRRQSTAFKRVEKSGAGLFCVDSFYHLTSKQLKINASPLWLCVECRRRNNWLSPPNLSPNLTPSLTPFLGSRSLPPDDDDDDHYHHQKLRFHRKLL